MASAGAGTGLIPAVDPLASISPIPGGGPAVSPGKQPPPYTPVTGGFCNGIDIGFARANPGMVVYQQASPIPKASPPGTPGWQPSRPPNAAGSWINLAAIALPAVTVFNPAGNSWYIRKSGSDFNGGSSPTVLASGSDLVTYGTAGHSGLSQNVLTSASANFTSVLQGHWLQFIRASGAATLVQILEVIDAHTLIVRPEIAALGAPTAATGQSYIIGGAWQNLNMAFGATYSVATLNHPNRSSIPAPLAPGDTVYIGGGTYRETFILNQNGLPGRPITMWGDTDGFFTGDVGEVIFTAWVNGDSLAPSNTQVMAGNQSVGFIGWRFVNLTMLSFAAMPLSMLWLQFLNCTVIDMTGNALSWTVPSSDRALNGLFFSSLGAGPLIDGCTIVSFGSSPLSVSQSPPAGNNISLPPTTKTYDVNAIIRNSILFCTSGNASISITGPGVLFGYSIPAGVRLYNCLLVGSIQAASNNPVTDLPAEVHNCIVQAGVAFSGQILGSIVESYNVILANSLRSNVSIGVGSSGSQLGGTTAVPQQFAPMLDFGREFKLSGVLRRHFFSPSVGSELDGFGFQQGGPPGTVGLVTGYAVPTAPLQTAAYPNAATFPTLAPTPTDFMGRYRLTENGLIIPGALPATSPGAIEVHDSATEDSAVFQTTAPSGMLVGAGDQEVRIPVDAVANTVSVSIMYDSNYQGLPPIIQLVTANEIGVQQQTQQAPYGVPGIWSTLTLSSFTPTAPGFVLLRIISQDLSGISQVNFDTLAVA